MSLISPLMSVLQAMAEAYKCPYSYAPRPDLFEV